MLDKLVNGFLDGTIDKETYLVKKDELIKTKTDLQERKFFGIGFVRLRKFFIIRKN